MAKLRNCFANTTESVILTLAGDSKHPDFKQLQAIIKELNADTGLLNSVSSL
jgi:hypothetical protein